MSVTGVPNGNDSEPLDDLIRLNYVKSIDIPDVQVLQCVQNARRQVDDLLRGVGMTDREISSDLSVDRAEKHHKTVSLRTTMMVAAATREIMNLVEDELEPDQSRQQLVRFKVPDISDLTANLKEFLKNGDESKLFKLIPYLHSTKKIEGNTLSKRLTDGTDDEAIATNTGALHLDVNPIAANLARSTADAFVERFSILHDEHRRHEMSMQMRDWERWKDKIEIATEADMEKIVSVYESVRIAPEDLWRLRPDQSTEERLKGTKRVQKEGGFLYSCDRNDIISSLKSGRVLKVKTPQNPDEIAAYYAVISDPSQVSKYMEQELRFDPSKKYRSVGDLPQVRNTNIEIGSAEKRRVIHSIESVNPHLALIAFQAAKNNTLTWSVDQALRPMPEKNGPQSGEALARNAGLATALKKVQYLAEQESGKTHVIMKIFQIVAVGKADDEEWLESGTLAYPVRNRRSFHMNENIGAETAFVVEEDVLIGDIRVRVRWHYLVNPLDQALVA